MLFKKVHRHLKKIMYSKNNSSQEKPKFYNGHRNRKNHDELKISNEDFDQKKLPLMLGMINAIVEDKKLELNWEAFR